MTKSSEVERDNDEGTWIDELPELPEIPKADER